MKKVLLSTTIAVIFSMHLLAQGSGISLGNPSYHIMDRLEIISGIEAPYHSSLKPYLRGDVIKYSIHLDTTYNNWTEKDKYDLSYLFKDNNEWLSQSEHATAIAHSKEPAYKKVYVDSTKTFYKLETNQASASAGSNYYIAQRKTNLKILL